jgi:hypothetical protein
MQTPGSAGHSESAWQPRHVFVPIPQMGFAGTLQSAFVSHSRHRPDAEQTCPDAAQSAADWQPRHVLVV